MSGERRHAIRAAFDQLGRARLGVGALAVMHAGPHQIPGERPIDEHYVPVGPRDAGAAERDRIDPQLQLVAERRTLDEVAAHPSSHSSSAF